MHADVVTSGVAPAAWTHWRTKLSIHEALTPGTLRRASAVALMMKSLTDSLVLSSSVLFKSVRSLHQRSDQTTS